MDVDKYDEYYSNRPSREVITVETKIKSTNVGFSMLAKMGWVEGTPLGVSGEGTWCLPLHDARLLNCYQAVLNLCRSM